jgi:hypothetical protein
VSPDRCYATVSLSNAENASWSAVGLRLKTPWGSWRATPFGGPELTLRKPLGMIGRHRERIADLDRLEA